jgi:trk system potassium uptake protein
VRTHFRSSKPKPLLDVRDRAPGVPRLGKLAAYLWFFATILSYALLRSSAAMVHGNRLTADRAVFAVLNSSTLTGFQTSIGPADFLWLGQTVIVLLTLISSICALLLGGLALVRLLRLRISDERIALWSLGVPLIGASFIGMIFAQTGTPFLHAMMAGVGAIGNCAITFDTVPIAGDWATHVLLMPAAIVGGMGVVVLIELYDRFFGKHRISTHSSTTIAMTAGFYLGATAVLATIIGAAMARETGDARLGVAGGITQASVLAVASRTAGFSIPVSSLPRIAQWLLLPLMAIGAGSAGTGGGLKVTAVMALIDGTRRLLRGAAVTRVLGVVLMWTGVYLSIVTLTLLALLELVPQIPGERLLFLAVSATSNVGLSHDPLSLTGAALHALCFAMLCGRIIPIVILYRAARTTHAELGIA